ncbi:MAG TPA: hypothetical protein VMR99_03305 [Candidatus Paceibacterota bacterium]|nr:hypothetical protein [Candidatus Paceibacterota bacterium]
MKKAFALIAVLMLGYAAKTVFAQTSSTSITPMVSIADITNVIYPLPLPSGGGPITFAYKVTNPGTIPLNDITVIDSNCANMSGELGDTNGNRLLDPGETWIYTCATVLTKTIAHTATVTAYANGLEATDAETTTVDVPGSSATSSLSLPNGGSNPNSPSLPANGPNPNTLNITVLIWEILGGILVVLVIVYFVLTRKKQ